MKDLTQLAQAAEQAEAAMESIANITVILFNKLIDQGMTREEALELAKIYLESVSSPCNGGGGWRD